MREALLVLLLAAMPLARTMEMPLRHPRQQRQHRALEEDEGEDADLLDTMEVHQGETGNSFEGTIDPGTGAQLSTPPLLQLRRSVCVCESERERERGPRQR